MPHYRPQVHVQFCCKWGPSVRPRLRYSGRSIIKCLQRYHFRRRHPLGIDMCTRPCWLEYESTDLHLCESRRLQCQNDRKCCTTELSAHSRRKSLHVLARTHTHTHTHTRVLSQVDIVSVADSQMSDITECSVSDAQPSRHLLGSNGIFCPCFLCCLDTTARELWALCRLSPSEQREPTRIIQVPHDGW